jgi:hypothetical protein
MIRCCKWYDVFDLPMFLQQYADSNLPVWIGNAFLACQYKEDREYLIRHLETIQNNVTKTNICIS